MGLQTISQTVVEYISANSTNGLPGNDARAVRRREDKFQRVGIITALSGFTLFLLLIVSFLITSALGRILGFNTNIFDVIGPWVGGIGFLVLLIGLGLAVYPRIVKELFKRESPVPVGLLVQDHGAKLPSDYQLEPGLVGLSITENTTRSFEPALGNEPRVTGEKNLQKDEE